jgi:hypothetical protein
MKTWYNIECIQSKQELLPLVPWRLDFQLYRWVGNPELFEMYSEENKEEKPCPEDDCITDESLSWKTSNWSTFSYFQDYQNESECLYGAS